MSRSSVLEARTNLATYDIDQISSDHTAEVSLSRTSRTGGFTNNVASRATLSSSLQIFETLPSMMHSNAMIDQYLFVGVSYIHGPEDVSQSNDDLSSLNALCPAHEGAPTLTSTPYNDSPLFRGPAPKSPKSDSSDASRRRSSQASSLARPVSMSSGEPSPVITGHNVPQMGTGGKGSSHSRRSSVSSQAKIKVEKLEEALKHIGIEPSLDQQLELRTRINVDADGTVSYGDFVAAARELFKEELMERNVLLGTSAKQHKTDMLRQQAVHQASYEESERLRQEQSRLMTELENVKQQLREKDRHCNKLETELLVLKTETKEALQENKALKKKVHLSEQAQKAARSLEQDYEDVVKLLETENAQLRASLSKQGDSAETTKRIASLNAELRKAELGVKTYEVAVEKLLAFANLAANNLGAHRESTAPDQQAANKKRHTPQTLAQDARDVIKLVKSLIEHDPLPFGWQEVYTPDGNRYYVNHLMKTSTWIHPASQVQH